MSLAIFSYAFVDPGLIYLKSLYTGFAFQHRLAVTILYVVIVISFFFFYFIFLTLVKKEELDFKKIKFLILVTSGILLFSYPTMLSYDIFNYIATAKVSFFYHENPYLIMPIEFIGDPLLSFTHAANKIALYGPFWIILTAIPYLLGFGKFILILFNFKLFVLVFYLATIFLIWKISKNFLSVVIFAFNPLVIMETLISSHNDIVMMFFALLAFYFLIKEKPYKAFVFLLLSVLIKYATLFLLPVFMYTSIVQLKNKKINWGRVFYSSSILMLIVFLLSPIREEIYPWYAIWFLIFLPFIQNKILKYIYIAFSFSLLLRYIPFMYLGTYFNPTPIIKFILTFLPPSIVIVFLSFKYLCSKYRYR